MRIVAKNDSENGQRHKKNKAHQYAVLVLGNAPNSSLFPSKSKSGRDLRAARGVEGDYTFIVGARLRSWGRDGKAAEITHRCRTQLARLVVECVCTQKTRKPRHGWWKVGGRETCRAVQCRFDEA
jgi:hypothetical protein